MKKKILIVIIVLLIVIFIILGTLLKNSNTENNINNNLNNLTVKENVSIQLEQVQGATPYFTVQSCVNKYITYVAEKDNDSVYKILDNEYIEKNNITKSNVLNKIEEIQEAVIFEAEKMYVEEIDQNNNKYYVLGILKQDNLEEGEKIINNNFKIAVSLDFENMIFSVMPLEDGGIFDEKNN